MCECKAVIKGMSKDEDENKESNDIGDKDEKHEEWAQFNLVDVSMYL